MSHEHVEILMPPTEDVEAAVRQIMAPFDENGKGDDDDEGPSKYAFWDFWVIGGRWAGAHVTALVDPGRLEQFQEELIRRNVTVSRVTAGKQTLKPESQIEMVDALWREWFPESGLVKCPLFSHFLNQYKNSEGYPDVIKLADLPEALTAARVIVAVPKTKWLDDSKVWELEQGFEAEFMMQNEAWNGLSCLNVDWDGLVKTAVEMYQKRLAGMDPDYAKIVTPTPEWLVVTVDIHSWPSPPIGRPR